jgi:hypothetical protein
MVPEHPFNQMKPNSGGREVLSEHPRATIFPLARENDGKLPQLVHQARARGTLIHAALDANGAQSHVADSIADLFWFARV